MGLSSSYVASRWDGERPLAQKFISPEAPQLEIFKVENIVGPYPVPLSQEIPEPRVPTPKIMATPLLIKIFLFCVILRTWFKERIHLTVQLWKL